MCSQQASWKTRPSQPLHQQWLGHMQRLRQSLCNLLENGRCAVIECFVKECVSGAFLPNNPCSIRVWRSRVLGETKFRTSSVPLVFFLEIVQDSLEQPRPCNSWPWDVSSSCSAPKLRFLFEAVSRVRNSGAHVHALRFRG